MEKIVVEQKKKKKHVSDSILNTEFQQAGHSTTTTMAQITNDFLIAIIKS